MIVIGYRFDPVQLYLAESIDLSLLPLSLSIAVSLSIWPMQNNKEWQRIMSPSPRWRSIITMHISSVCFSIGLL